MQGVAIHVQLNRYSTRDISVGVRRARTPPAPKVAPDLSEVRQYYLCVVAIQ
jgi:hypothetical protein